MSELKRCTADKCCDFLSGRLGDGGKGFKAEHTLHMEENAEHAEMQLLGVVYKTSAKDRGLLMNWCPFCGGQPGHFERKITMPEVER